MNYLNGIAALALAASTAVSSDSNPLQRSVLREGDTEIAYRGECIKGETPYFEETLLERNLKEGKTTRVCVISNGPLVGGTNGNCPGLIGHLSELQPANHDALWRKCVGEPEATKK